MGWTIPRTWQPNDVPGASDFNTQFRDNFNWLISGRARGYNRGSSGNYTTTSGPLVDVDGTNLAFTFTPISTHVLIAVSGAVACTNTIAYSIALNVDGVDTTYIAGTFAAINTPVPFCFTAWLTLTMAAHTIKLRYAGGTTLTMYGTGSYPVNMSIVEVS